MVLRSAQAKICRALSGSWVIVSFHMPLQSTSRVVGVPSTQHLACIIMLVIQINGVTIPPVFRCLVYLQARNLPQRPTASTGPIFRKDRVYLAIWRSDLTTHVLLEGPVWP